MTGQLLLKVGKTVHKRLHIYTLLIMQQHLSCVYVCFVNVNRINSLLAQFLVSTSSCEKYLAFQLLNAPTVEAVTISVCRW